MSKPPRGRYLKMSAARKIVMEQLHHARKIPTLPLAKTVNVAPLVAARKAAAPAPSWAAIFMRAYGLVSQKRPELRRAAIRWPYWRLYEHPHSTCALLVERQWEGESIVLGTKIQSPENMTLAAIDARIRDCRERPVWEVSDFRAALRLGALPWLLRRFTFWQTLYLSGYKRAKRLGTFMMSSLGNMGVEQYHPLGCLTTYFTFGPIDAAGDVVVKIVYDHHVMDGRCVAQCLGDLEETLQTTLLAELQALAGKKAPGIQAA